MPVRFMFVVALVGCATAPQRLPPPPPVPEVEALSYQPPSMLWLGFVVVETTPQSGGLLQAVFLLSAPEAGGPDGHIRLNTEQGVRVAGVKMSGYWRFQPPDNPKLVEVRVYEGGGVFGVAEDEGPNCRVFYRATPALSRLHTGQGVVLTTMGVRGRLLLFVPPVFDHTEGPCPESPHRGPARPPPASPGGIPA